MAMALPYLIVFGLSAPHFGAMFWYFVCWQRRREQWVKRTAVWLIGVLAVWLIPLAQLAIFRHMTGLRPLHDKVVLGWVCAQAIADLIVVFSYSVRQRKKLPR